MSKFKYTKCVECCGRKRVSVEGINRYEMCYACRGDGTFATYARQRVGHTRRVLGETRKHVIELRNKLRMMERAIAADDKERAGATPN